MDTTFPDHADHGDGFDGSASGDAGRTRLLLLSAIALFLLGIVGSVWCYNAHICMAGHMHHPPYPAWHPFVDLGWATALLLGGALSIVAKGRKLWWLAALCVLFVLFRFRFGSFGGLVPLPI